VEPEAALWPRALSAGRASGTAAALLLFLFALTLEDLRLVRFSLVYPGALAAALAFAFVPAVSAARIVEDAQMERPEAPGLAVESALIRRRGLMGLTIAAFAIWLALFASGLTPRW
jgi:hypothetical protein